MVRKFRNCGFEGPHYGSGNSPHPFMKKGTQKVHIPNDHGADIGVGLLRRVLRIAGISDDQWEEA